MKKREICAAALLLLFAAGALGVLNYIVFYRPIFVQPELDRTFLSNRPTRAEVLAYFRYPPVATIKSGERFQMTGWRPLPTRAASHLGCAFTQDYNKIYIFFDAEDRVEEFVIATS
jgi:hypothetical protein